jgi:hypothetical protein
MKMTVYWDVAPCSLLDIDRRFRGAYCLHQQSDKPEDRYFHTRRSDNLKSHQLLTYSFSLDAITTLNYILMYTE